MKKITFVIPCYRSAKTIGTVINEIENMLLNNPKYDFEIIAVNDCSPDNVWEILSEYASQKCYLKIIDLKIVIFVFK